jgi:hypothetical protein
MRFPVSFWKPAAGGGSAPTVASVSPTLGDTLGGELLTVTGTGFTGATAVSVGGTAAIGFSVISSTEIIAIAPAHAAATGQSVLVTIPAGTNGANALYEFWSPAVLALTGFWERGDYDAQTGVWTARPSAGTSGGRNFTQATVTSRPTETNLEPVFNGVNGQLGIATPDVGTFFTASAGTIVAVFASRVDDAPGAGTNEISILSDNISRLALTVTTSGLGLFLFDGATQIVRAVATTNNLHLGVARWGGGTLGVAVDGGVESAAAFGALDVTSGTLTAGVNSSNAFWFNGSLRAILFLASRIADTDAAKLLKWAQARHGVAT